MMVIHDVYKAHYVLDRRLQEQAPLITAACIDHSGDRLFLGLEDGLLEEYRLIHSDNSCSCSLSARKRIVKKVCISWYDSL